MDVLTTQSLLTGVLSHLLTIGGFLLALLLVARLMSEKRQPSNTVAWLMGIVLVPYIGVPLYLLLGGRKLRRLISRKKRVSPEHHGVTYPTATCSHLPIAKTITAGGGSAPVGGNSVQLLTTGEEDYRTLEAGILSATHTIHITTFILGRDETGRRIVRLLTQRAREGIKVRLLLDAVGCMFLSSRFIASIREAGGEVQWFMPVLNFTPRGSANLRNHRKIATFDHATALVGGRNIAKEYMGATRYKKRWTDFGTRIDGPAAAMLNDVFIADWCFASKQDPATLEQDIPETAMTQVIADGELQVVASGPDVEGDPLYDGLVAMVQSADKSIWIITPYFIPDEVLLRSLIIKARAGCAITLIVPAHSNHPVTDFARKHYLKELREEGVSVQLYGPGMLHAKVTIVDDCIALFGSANFDLRSLFVNFEIGVIAHTKSEVRAIKSWAESLLSSCTTAKPAKDRRYPLLSNLAEDLSRLLGPLL